MLFWLKFFTILIIFTLFTVLVCVENLLSFILTSEFLIVLIFFCYLFNSLILNLNWIFGFSFIIIILGGLELALSFLLLQL